MPDVVMPDGTVIKGVPEGTTKEELMAKLEASQGTSAPGAFQESLARRMVDNLLATPSATGDLLAAASAGVQATGGAVADLATGQPTSFLDDFSSNFDTEKERFPANVVRSIPRPTTVDLQATGIFAGDLVRRVMSTPMDEGLMVDQLAADDFNSQDPIPEFEQSRDEILEGVLNRREANPKSSAFGDLAGDGFTLATLRAPFASAARRSRLAKTDAPKVVQNNTKQILDDVVNSKIVQGLKGGGIKVGEAGFEGALMAAVTDEDPLSSAALAAGSQASGSLLRTAGATPKGIAATAAATFAAIQLFKSATPDELTGDDSIVETGEEAFNKLMALMALGGLATIAGAGRSSTDLANKNAILADALTSIPRGSTLSLINDVRNDQSGNIEAVLNQLSQDPEFFSQTAQRRLERALNGQGELSFKETIESLSDSDRQFKRKVLGLSSSQIVP